MSQKYTAEEVQARVGFVISDREPRILTWESGGCRPASIAECALWDANDMAEPVAHTTTKPPETGSKSVDGMAAFGYVYQSPDDDPVFEYTVDRWSPGLRYGTYTETPVYTAPPAQPAERVPDGWRVLQIGAVGSAYDPPNTRRAFTYDWQPGNGDAWALGKASSAAAKASAGDYIDSGLSLLKALQEQGFGVFQIEPLASPSPAPSPARGDGGEVDRSPFCGLCGEVFAYDTLGEKHCACTTQDTRP